MVHGLRERLGATASAHVEAMDRVATLEGLLGETGNIARIGGTFESVQKNNLAARGLRQLMFIGDNRGARIDCVFNASSGEAYGIHFARPEIACDGQQMRIAEERVEWR